jgi:hypothetical protein
MKSLHEFERAAITIENLHKEELHKALQTQKDEMNAEFERKAHTYQNLHKESWIPLNRSTLRR